MRSWHSSPRYRNLDDLTNDRDNVAWYWRLIALAASWMILGGYLILPATYDSDPKLRFSKGVLSIFIVALMTAGYSFTGLLCFACRNWMFQAESVFLPALTSSALGLLTVLYNLISSTRFQWNTAAIVTTVLASCSSILYGLLLLWAHRKIARVRQASYSRANNMWPQDNAYLSNYIQNMYPSARSPSDPPPHLTDDDMVNQQMAMLLMKSDPGPSPDASQSTFRIDLPTDVDEEDLEQLKLLQQRQYQQFASQNPAARLTPQQHALLQAHRAQVASAAHAAVQQPSSGSPTSPSRSPTIEVNSDPNHPDLLNPPTRLANDYIRGRSASLTGAAATAEARGTTWDRPSDSRGRAPTKSIAPPTPSSHGRAVSREERRREIEMGMSNRI